MYPIQVTDKLKRRPKSQGNTPWNSKIFVIFNLWLKDAKSLGTPESDKLSQKHATTDKTRFKFEFTNHNHKLIQRQLPVSLDGLLKRSHRQPYRYDHHCISTTYKPHLIKATQVSASCQAP